MTFSPQSPAEPSPTMPQSAAIEAEQFVGVNRDIRAVERELDAVISDLFAASAAAMANGDPHGSRLYTERAYAAIASRTPEHMARMWQEVEQRITESNEQ